MYLDIKEHPLLTFWVVREHIVGAFSRQGALPRPYKCFGIRFPRRSRLKEQRCTGSMHRTGVFSSAALFKGAVGTARAADANPGNQETPGLGCAEEFNGLNRPCFTLLEQ